MAHNIQTQVKAGKLLIMIDLTSPTYESASGKSKILASTQGNHEVVGNGVPAGLVVGVNAYLPKKTVTE